MYTYMYTYNYNHKLYIYHITIILRSICIHYSYSYSLQHIARKSRSSSDRPGMLYVGIELEDGGGSAAELRRGGGIATNSYHI